MKNRPAMLFRAITERTAREWPEDHPLRRNTSILADDSLDRADYVVCSDVGEPRIPPPPDDSDVQATCPCGRTIIHRASAPPNTTKICFECWSAM